MQLLSLRCTVYHIMLLIWGTLAEVKEDDIDTIKTRLEQEKESITLPRNEEEIRIPDLEKRLDNQCDKRTTNGVVGFTVTLFQNQIYPASKKIVFDRVLENQGGAYNSGTGVFRAPYRGMYLFSVTIHSYVQSRLELELMKNYSKIGRVVAGDSKSDWGDSGSVSVITTMNENDEVYLTNLESVKIFGWELSSFMGVLISRF